jgi:hypothetical protein
MRSGKHFTGRRKRFAEPHDEAAQRKPLCVSVREAVRLSDLGKVTLYKLMNSGVLISRKIGHRRLIEYSSLEALLIGRTPEEADHKTVYRRWDEMWPS